VCSTVAVQAKSASPPASESPCSATMPALRAFFDWIVAEAAG